MCPGFFFYTNSKLQEYKDVRFTVPTHHTYIKVNNLFAAEYLERTRQQLAPSVVSPHLSGAALLVATMQ